MNKKLTLQDSINIGNRKKLPISEIVNKKGEIFKYIKEGYQFDDEVLQMAHIKKTISNERVVSELATHLKTSHKKIYQKDTESLKKIIKSISTIDNQNNNEDGFLMEYDGDDDILTLNEE